MIKLAEKAFTWAIKRTCVMMCEIATKRDARGETPENRELHPERATRDQRRRSNS